MNETDPEWLQKPIWNGPIPTNATHSSLQKFDILCQAICLTVATLLIMVRIYTKAWLLRSLGWDDCESTLRKDASTLDRAYKESDLSVAAWVSALSSFTG